MEEGKVTGLADKESPCENCKRVAKPEECGNKNCGAWREWFLSRWEQIHNYGEKHKA